MKSNQIVKIIKDNKLEDFDIYVSFVDGYNIFPNVITTPVSELIETENGVHLHGEEETSSPLKGSELIKLINDKDLGDKELPFGYTSTNGIESIRIIELGDIGHSDNVAHFQAEDK